MNAELNFPVSGECDLTGLLEVSLGNKPDEEPKWFRDKVRPAAKRISARILEEGRVEFFGYDTGEAVSLRTSLFGSVPGLAGLDRLDWDVFLKSVDGTLNIHTLYGKVTLTGCFYDSSRHSGSPTGGVSVFALRYRYAIFHAGWLPEDGDVVRVNVSVGVDLDVDISDGRAVVPLGGRDVEYHYRSGDAEKCGRFVVEGSKSLGVDGVSSGGDLAGFEGYVKWLRHILLFLDPRGAVAKEFRVLVKDDDGKWRVVGKLYSPLGFEGGGRKVKLGGVGLGLFDNLVSQGSWLQRVFDVFYGSIPFGVGFASKYTVPDAEMLILRVFSLHEQGVFKGDEVVKELDCFEEFGTVWGQVVGCRNWVAHVGDGGGCRVEKGKGHWDYKDTSVLCWLAEVALMVFNTGVLRRSGVCPNLIKEFIGGDVVSRYDRCRALYGATRFYSDEGEGNA